MLVLALASSLAMADQVRACVFDPVGAAGDAWTLMQDYQAAAAAHGLNLDMTPYTDEATAVADFRSGRCDVALVTGLGARPFLPRTATLEAIGALPTYDHLKDTVKLFASEKAASLAQNGDYETIGIYPGGSVYLYVHDRSWTDARDIAGKRISTIDGDGAAAAMVKRVGASAVSADIGTFANLFNNGGVDVTYAPASAYKPLELYRGLGSSGGILQLTLSQLTLQVIARKDVLPEGFGVWSRGHVYSSFDRALGVVQSLESEVDGKYWINLPESDVVRYQDMFRDVRVTVRDEGLYDAKALTLLRKVRCRRDPNRAECSESVE